MNVAQFTVRHTTSDVWDYKITHHERVHSDFTEALHDLRLRVEFGEHTAVVAAPGNLILATGHREDGDTVIRIIGRK